MIHSQLQSAKAVVKERPAGKDQAAAIGIRYVINIRCCLTGQDKGPCNRITAYLARAEDRYASFTGAQFPTRCDAQLTENNFQIHPKRHKLRYARMGKHLHLI